MQGELRVLISSYDAIRAMDVIELPESHPKKVPLVRHGGGAVCVSRDREEALAAISDAIQRVVDIQRANAIHRPDEDMVITIDDDDGEARVGQKRPRSP